MHSLWKSSQFLISWSWRRPSRTRAFASSRVPTSISSGPCSLPAFSVFCFHASFRNFTLSFSCGFWSCSSAKAFSWLAVSILLVLTACTITLNHRPFTFVLPAITLVHPSSCSIMFLVSWLSVVIMMLPLSNCYAASTLPALLEQAALIDSTSLPLVCLGLGSSTTFTNTSFSALLGTGFSWVLWARARREESA